MNKDVERGTDTLERHKGRGRTQKEHGQGHMGKDTWTRAHGKGSLGKGIWKSAHVQGRVGKGTWATAPGYGHLHKDTWEKAHYIDKGPSTRAHGLAQATGKEHMGKFT